MSFMDEARESRARAAACRIVYPEGLEERAHARGRPPARPGPGAARPRRAGARRSPRARTSSGVPLDGIEVRDPADDPRRERLRARLPRGAAAQGRDAERSRASARPCRTTSRALMVQAGEADGFVSGLDSETKPFLPAFEIVRLREGFKRASSVFIMVWPERVLFYADCSVNIAPDAATLAEIGRATAATARSFGIEPRVAFLSFSTRGSAEHADVERVREAARAVPRGGARRCRWTASCSSTPPSCPRWRRRSAPTARWAAQANVFVFPDLDAGNIAYKITERLAGASAVGPILQGLRRAVNDVSRGCSVQDLADVGVITAVQALALGTGA